MIVSARKVPGSAGAVELLVDGVPVNGVRCIPGSARVSRGQIEFTAHIQAAPYDETVRQEETDEDNG